MRPHERTERWKSDARCGASREKSPPPLPSRPGVSRPSFSAAGPPSALQRPRTESHLPRTGGPSRGRHRAGRRGGRRAQAACLWLPAPSLITGWTPPQDARLISGGRRRPRGLRSTPSWATGRMYRTSWSHSTSPSATTSCTTSGPAPFLEALSQHARRRVVIEMTPEHPLAWMSDLWMTFHGLRAATRPDLPRRRRDRSGAGLRCPVGVTEGPPVMSGFDNRGDAVAFIRKRLCLWPKDDERAGRGSWRPPESKGAACGRPPLASIRSPPCGGTTLVS